MRVLSVMLFLVLISGILSNIAGEVDSLLFANGLEIRATAKSVRITTKALQGTKKKQARKT